MSGTAVRIIRVAIVLVLIMGLSPNIIHQFSVYRSTWDYPVTTTVSTDYTSCDAGGVSTYNTQPDSSINCFSYYLIE